MFLGQRQGSRGAQGKVWGIKGLRSPVAFLSQSKIYYMSNFKAQAIAPHHGFVIMKDDRICSLCSMSGSWPVQAEPDVSDLMGWIRLKFVPDLFSV